MELTMTTVNDQNTLDATTWFERMGRLVEGLNDKNGRPDRHIRKAYHLLCLAPTPIKRMLPDPIPESRLESLLECGAYESAVICILGGAGHVTVTTSGDERGIEIRLRIDPQAHQTTHESWSIALLEAWAVSFLRLRALPH